MITKIKKKMNCSKKTTRWNSCAPSLLLTIMSYSSFVDHHILKRVSIAVNALTLNALSRSGVVVCQDYFDEQLPFIIGYKPHTFVCTIKEMELGYVQLTIAKIQSIVNLSLFTDSQCMSLEEITRSLPLLRRLLIEYIGPPYSSMSFEKNTMRLCDWENIGSCKKLESLNISTCKLDDLLLPHTMKRCFFSLLPCSLISLAMNCFDCDDNTVNLLCKHCPLLESLGTLHIETKHLCVLEKELLFLRHLSFVVLPPPPSSSSSTIKNEFFLEWRSLTLTSIELLDMDWPYSNIRFLSVTTLDCVSVSCFFYSIHSFWLSFPSVTTFIVPSDFMDIPPKYVDKHYAVLPPLEKKKSQKKMTLDCSRLTYKNYKAFITGLQTFLQTRQYNNYHIIPPLSPRIFL